MSEYWDPLEYVDDVYETFPCGLEFYIRVNHTKQIVSDSYYYRVVKEEKEDAVLQNILFSAVADMEMESESFGYDVFKAFALEENASVKQLSKFILHNDLIEFIRNNLPYLYNKSLLSFVKQWEREDYLDYGLEQSLTAFCHNLFFALNNVQVKTLIEQFIAKKYKVENVCIEVIYKESVIGEMQVESSYEPDYEEVEIWYESVNRFFPMPNRELDKSILKEALDADIIDFDQLMRSCYYYVSDGVKIISIQFLNDAIEIIANIYQVLFEEGKSEEDYRRYQFKVYRRREEEDKWFSVHSLVGRNDVPLYLNEIDEVNGEAFGRLWTDNISNTAVYLTILSDKKLRNDLNNAKNAWIENETKWEAEYQIRKLECEKEERLAAKKKKETERIAEEQRKQEEDRKRVAREQDFLQEKQKQEKIKVACQRVEKFLADSTHNVLYVKHDDYGAGVVETLTDSYGMRILTVVFKGDTKKTFEYPKCFGATLAFINEDEYRNATPPPPKKDPYWNY